MIKSKIRFFNLKIHLYVIDSIVSNLRIKYVVTLRYILLSVNRDDDNERVHCEKNNTMANVYKRVLGNKTVISHCQKKKKNYYV